LNAGIFLHLVNYPFLLPFYTLLCYVHYIITQEKSKQPLRKCLCYNKDREETKIINEALENIYKAIDEAYGIGVPLQTIENATNLEIKKIKLEKNKKEKPLTLSRKKRRLKTLKKT
jgi:hypothetical protein